MPRRLKALIKRFDFTTETRSLMDLSGGLRHVPGSTPTGQSRLELPQTATGYDTDDQLTATTWLSRIGAAKEWRSFQEAVTHRTDDTNTVVTFSRYRISDGVTTYWWDGAAWSAVTPLDTEWNTAAEVANNLSTFPIAQQAIQVVINLYTTDERYTPVMTGVKVLYGSDIEHQEDYITRSLVPDLRTNIRPIGRVLIAQATTGVTLAFDSDVLETPYDVVEVDSVYNQDTDPNHLTDLLDSWDGSQITLNASVTAGVNLFVRFIYRPLVARRTSRDYTEVGRVPCVHITEVAYINEREALDSDSVLNYDSNIGTKVRPAKVRDIECVLRFITDSLVDYDRLAQALTDHFTNNPLLRSTGLDEEFAILIAAGPEMAASVNSKDTHSGELRIQILNAVFFERGSEQVYGAQSFNLGGTPQPGTKNPNLTVS